MTKEAKTHNGVKTGYSTNGVGKIGQIHAKKKKKKLDHLLTHTQELNSKRVKDLNDGLKTTEIEKKNKQ